MGELVARVPIIQGGMGVGISLSGLAAAVANEGGIGVIATAGIGMAEPDFFRNFLEANDRALRREIRTARAATTGVLGVNIMVALSNYADLVRMAIDEGIDVIFSGAGLPMHLPELPARGRDQAVRAHRLRAAPRRSSCRRWTDITAICPTRSWSKGRGRAAIWGSRAEQITDPAFALEGWSRK